MGSVRIQCIVVPFTETEDPEEKQFFWKVKEQNKKKYVLACYLGATCWTSKFKCLVGSWIFTTGIWERDKGYAEKTVSLYSILMVLETIY